LHLYLLDAFDLRQMNDCDAYGTINPDRAHLALTRAKEFVDSADTFLRQRRLNQPWTPGEPLV